MVPTVLGLGDKLQVIQAVVGSVLVDVMDMQRRVNVDVVKSRCDHAMDPRGATSLPSTCPDIDESIAIVGRGLPQNCATVMASVGETAPVVGTDLSAGTGEIARSTWDWEEERHLIAVGIDFPHNIPTKKGLSAPLLRFCNVLRIQC
jgi:hypothetical protein